MAASTSTQSDEDYFFGWNLFYNTIIKEVNKKADVLIALAHFILAKHFNFRCLGNGDKMTFSDEEEASELLPDNWNQDDFKYSLRYLVHNQLYLLLGHISEENLIINLLIADSKVVSNINLHPNSLVRTTEVLDLNQLIPEVDFLGKRYRRELIDPVFRSIKRNKSLQTDPQPLSTTTLSTYNMSDSHRNLSDISSGHLLNPLDIGREDLDHFPYGGPGNLLPFPLHPEFGPEFRFDPDHPFGPPLPNPNPNLNQNSNPDLISAPNSNTNINPDHFPPPPPGYYM